MGFLRDRAVGHRSGFETLGDLLDGFDLVDWHRSAVAAELHQAAEGREVLALVVDLLGVLLEDLVAAGAGGLLEQVNGFRIEEVEFAVAAPLIDAAGVERGLLGLDVAVREGLAVADERFLGDLFDVRAFATAGSAAEILVHQIGGEADGFENLRAAVGGDGRDSHLGHGFHHPLDRAFEEIVGSLLQRDVEHVVLDHLVDGLERHVGVDRVRAVTDERGEMVDLAGLAGFEDDRDERAGAFADQIVVDAAHQQQRRDGGAALVDVSIGKNQQVEAFGDGGVRGGADFVESGFEPFAALVGGEQRVDGGGLEAVQLDFTEPGERLVVDERAVEADHAAALRSGSEQVALGAEEGFRGGDELLADAVERRVGDLGEDLLEILIEMLRLAGEHGERGVVAHRGDRLDAGRGGRSEQHAEILVGVAERELALEDALFLDGFRGFGGGKILERDAVVGEPLTIGLGGIDALFDFLVGDDAAFLHVHEEHLAGAQAAFFDDGHRVEIGNDTDFRGHDDEVVVGDIIAARAEAVAVEHGTDLLAVGEGDGGRAVPWLHHAGVEFVERLLVLIHHGVAFPRLGNHHHHGVDQVVAAVVHEFQGVVEARGVGAVLVDDREDVFDFRAEKVRLAERLAGLHEIGVAHDRVDLAVVGDEAVRMGARPAREGVGRETGVHQRQRRFVIRVEKIREIGGKLAGREHALVNHGSGGEAGDVVIVRAGEGVALVAVDVAELVRHLVVADPRADALADDVELALEGHRVGDVGAFADENLFDDRLVAAGGLAENFAPDRHGAPAEELLAFLADDEFEDLHGDLSHRGFRREKRTTRAVFAFRRELDAFFRHFPAQELVRHLGENARAVAGRRIRSAGTAVVHLFVHREGFHDDVMRALAFEMGDEADAAGIFFARRMPEALRFRPAKWRFLR